MLYAPAIASPNSTLLGTTGPSGTVALDFHESGNREEHRTVKANVYGRFGLHAPANAIGIDFSAGGAVVHCVISRNRELIVGGLTRRRAGSGALAIVAAQTAYDIAQPLQLQVEHFDPLADAFIVDSDRVPLLAASDRSIIAQIEEAIPLGRHGIAIVGKNGAAAVQVDIVRTHLSVTGPSDYRIPRTVTLTVDGLYGDRATTTFDVGGGAVLADNEDTITVPVTPTGEGTGESTTTVKANHPGQFNLGWKLNVGLKYDLGYGLPPITSYPTPTPQPVAEPTPYVPCTVRLTDGWFEATQGPYQDDPTFTEKPEQLIRTSDNPIEYYGRLDMIKDRPSLLMGVLAYVKDGTLKKIGSRNGIVMKGESNCEDGSAVKMRFTLHEHSQNRIIYTSPVIDYVYLRGNSLPRFRPWEVRLSSFSGVPDVPFTFTAAGTDYAIDAQLLDDHNNPLPFKMWVEGNVVATEGPVIRLLPVILAHSKSPTSVQDRSESLLIEAKRLRDELYEHVPDIFPLKPHGLPMPQVAEPIDLTDVVFSLSLGQHLDITTPASMQYRDNLQAAFADRFGTTSALQGPSRTVVLVNDGDFDKLVGTDANGITMSTKLVAVRWTRPWPTAAHEIAHTLPQFLFSADQMVAQCGLDYHNKDGTFAQGIQAMKLSKPISGEQRYGWPEDPMQGSGDDAWITQCTYDNLITALHGSLDPDVLLVRMVLAQPVRGGTVAKLRPFYVTHGTVSPSEKTGTFAIEAYNAAGHLLASIAFTPQWTDDNGTLHHLIAIQERLKYVPAIARVELRGPHNALLDSVAMSREAPTVTIDSAHLTGSRLHLAWRGTGDPGRQLLYSIFLSRDGQLYDDSVFEQKATRADLPLLRGYHPRFVKVVVTDGTRSSQTIGRIR